VANRLVPGTKGTINGFLYFGLVLQRLLQARVKAITRSEVEAEVKISNVLGRQNGEILELGNNFT